MKLPPQIQLLITGIATVTSLILPQLVMAQLPPIIDTTTVPANLPPVITTAAASIIRVGCQDLKTVVQKEDRQAVMIAWSSAYFGPEFTPLKRCELVAQKLQQAANENGGTLKGLELASGTVNAQPVICALKTGSSKCDSQNFLFTLKPENARNPNTIIQKIFTFAEDGSTSINESGNTRAKVGLDLGNWERKAFPDRKPAKVRDTHTGF
jgi:Circadian oscillating protein COP23